MLMVTIVTINSNNSKHQHHHYHGCYYHYYDGDYYYDDYDDDDDDDDDDGRHFFAQETQRGSHKHLKQLSLAILCDDRGRSSTTWSMRPEWCHTRSDLSGWHIIRACGLWGYHATGTWGMCRLQNPKRHYFLGQVGFSPFTGHGLVPVFALVLSRFCVSSSPTSNGGWPCHGTNHPLQLWQCVWITTFLPRYYKLHFTDSCYCAVTPKRNSLLHWLLRTSQGSDPDVQSLHSIFWWSLCRDLIPLIAVNPVDTSLFVTDSGPANLKWTWNIWVEPKIQGIHVARTGLWFFCTCSRPTISKNHIFPTSQHGFDGRRLGLRDKPSIILLVRPLFNAGCTS